MRTVFVDVDTQIDFLFAAGALYVPGAERILPAISRLNRYAASQGIPLISTVDAHAENDPEFRVWPPHCVVNTVGQQKPAGTLLDSRVVVSPGRVPDKAAAQIILEKQLTEFFKDLAPLIGAFPADRYVVYGVVTEICVRSVALGLLKRGEHVEVVADAVRGLSQSASEQLFYEVKAGGGVLTSAGSICG